MKTETTIHVDISSIKSIQSGFKIEGETKPMHGIVCSFIGDNQTLLSEHLYLDLEDPYGISAVNRDKIIYLTGSQLCTPVPKSELKDYFVASTIAQQIMINNSDIIFYTVDHLLRSNLEELNAIRTQITKNNSSSMIFVIHQIYMPRYESTGKTIEVLIEQHKTYHIVESSHLFGFTTNHDGLVTDHVFLLSGHDEKIKYDHNSLAIQYIQFIMDSYLSKIRTFSLIDAIQKEVSNILPRFITNNVDTFAMELVNNYIVPKNKIELDELLYCIASDDYSTITKLQHCVKEIDNEPVLFVEVPGRRKEDMTFVLNTDKFNVQTLVLSMIDIFDPEKRQICVQQFPYQIQPIDNPLEFLSRAVNKLENGILELHLQKAVF